jgi:hypothetical protein
MTTLQTISSTLQTALKDSQIILTPQTLSGFPLGDVFGLLQTDILAFEEATITAFDNTVALSGKVALLGASRAGVTLTFAESPDGTLVFDLAGLLPVGLLPGAPWLSLETLTVALQVVGAGNTVTGTLSGGIRSGGAAVKAQYQVSQTAGVYTLGWQVQDLDLQAIAALFLDGAALPAEVPNLVLNQVSARVTPSLGSFALKATATGT